MIFLQAAQNYEDKELVCVDLLIRNARKCKSPLRTFNVASPYVYNTMPMCKNFNSDLFYVGYNFSILQSLVKRPFSIVTFMCAFDQCF